MATAPIFKQTKPFGEDVIFRSSTTGEHDLDAYLEEAERGGKRLGELLAVAFDASGTPMFAVGNVQGAADAAIAAAAIATTKANEASTSAAAANAVLASKTTGPASSTDNTLPRFDGTTGKLLQGSGVVVDDSNRVTGASYTANNALATVATDGASVDWTLFESVNHGRFIAGRSGGNYANWSAWVAGASGVTRRFQITYDGITRWFAADGTTERMTLDSSGNLGIGLAPYATHSSIRGLTTGLGTSLVGRTGGNGTYLLESARITSTDPMNTGAGSVYLFNSQASAYGMFGGTHTWYTAPSGTAGNAITWNTAMTLDSSGNLTLSSGAFGYGAGAGGTVTQATSKTTGVTLNKPSGLITTHNAALAANTSVEFVLTNSFVSATDVVVLNLKNASIGFKYRAQVWEVVNGGVYIQLTNITGGSLSEAVPINFAVIKGSTT